MVIGGFLGAGKTTAIAELAKRLTDAGSTVGVVTNDQGRELVDTEFLSRYGFSVLEVTGGCFCCNFDELTSRLSEFGEAGGPDVVLAEPVGSCTDLVATIFRPLLRDFPDRYAPAPLTVLAEPKRTARYLRQVGRDLTTEVNFLFESQLTESDVIVLSKSDTLDSGSIDGLVSGLSAAFPGRMILPTSSETGEGFDRWLSLIATGAPELRSLSIDYGTYAEAEAALGWLNGSAVMTSDSAVSPDDIVETLLGDFRTRMQRHHAEVAHVKVYAMGTLDFARAGLTDAEGDIEFTKRASNASGEVSILVNARVQLDPQLLQEAVRAGIVHAAEELKCSTRDLRFDSFRPAPPSPTHRIRENERA
jgi:G3E family GTPase